jgi:sarcosine dehydrogenase
MGRQNWFHAVGDEHHHVRNQAGLFDQSSFAKYEMRGKDAAQVLDYICANDILKPAGRLTYTQLLNSKGGIECDLTVARLAEDHFYIVTGTGFRTHDFAWIRDHMEKGADASLEDVTENFGTLSLMGPNARAILAAATDADMSNEAFPFTHVQLIDIGGVPVRALRVTYVGELGWELHMPVHSIGKVFDALMEKGEDHYLRPVGYRALESLRLEKFYRAWGSDITPNDNPFEAGLGWAVKLKSGREFIGRNASAIAAGSPLLKTFAGFVTEDPAIVLVGRETILRNGRFAGYLTSGGYGYTIGKPVGYGYVRNESGVSAEWLNEGSYELVVANETVKANIFLRPLVDPEMRRIKA